MPSQVEDSGRRTLGSPSSRASLNLPSLRADQFRAEVFTSARDVLKSLTKDVPCGPDAAGSPWYSPPFNPIPLSSALSAAMKQLLTIESQLRERAVVMQSSLEAAKAVASQRLEELVQFCDADLAQDLDALDERLTNAHNAIKPVCNQLSYFDGQRSRARHASELLINLCRLKNCATSRTDEIFGKHVSDLECARDLGELSDVSMQLDAAQADIITRNLTAITTSLQRTHLRRFTEAAAVRDVGRLTEAARVLFALNEAESCIRVYVDAVVDWTMKEIREGGPQAVAAQPVPDADPLDLSAFSTITTYTDPTTFPTSPSEPMGVAYGALTAHLQNVLIAQVDPVASVFTHTETVLQAILQGLVRLVLRPAVTKLCGEEETGLGLLADVFAKTCTMLVGIARAPCNLGLATTVHNISDLFGKHQANYLHMELHQMELMDGVSPSTVIPRAFLLSPPSLALHNIRQIMEAFAKRILDDNEAKLEQSQFFDAARSANARLLELQKAVIDATGFIRRDKGLDSQAILAGSVHHRTLEQKIERGLNSWLEAAHAQIKTILRKQRRRNSYMPSEEVDFEEPTTVCREVCEIIAGVKKRGLESLDGRNLVSFLTCFGIGVLRTILQHLRTIPIAHGGGAMVLMRDVTEYIAMIEDFGIPGLSAEADGLRIIPKLHMVDPDSFDDIINDSPASKWPADKIREMKNVASTAFENLSRRGWWGGRNE